MEKFKGVLDRKETDIREEAGVWRGSVLHPYLCCPIDNPDLLSYDEGFLQSFREQMRGFCNALR
jgi:hypothetical protein